MAYGFDSTEIHKIYKTAYKAALQQQEDNFTIEDMRNIAGLGNSVEAAIKYYSDHCEERNYTIEEASIHYIEAARAVHNQWIIDNYPSKYDEPSRVDKKWQFGSFDTLGYEEASKDFTFVKPVFESRGIPFDEKTVKRMYGASVTAYAEKYNTQEAKDDFEIKNIKELTNDERFKNHGEREIFLKNVDMAPGIADTGNKRCNALAGNCIKDEIDAKFSKVYNSYIEKHKLNKEEIKVKMRTDPDTGKNICVINGRLYMDTVGDGVFKNVPFGMDDARAQKGNPAPDYIIKDGVAREIKETPRRFISEEDAINAVFGMPQTGAASQKLSFS